MNEQTIEQGLPEPEITLPSPEFGLREVATITRLIREHQQAIVNLGKRRKKVIVALRHQYGGRDGDQHVTYKQIAEAMETTDQSVYKILFPAPPKERLSDAEKIAAIQQRMEQKARRKAKKAAEQA